MNLTPDNQFSSKASQLLSWGHWFTFANIGLVLLISTSYLFADSQPSTALGWFYMLITWVSHTSFITFCAFVLTIFPLSLVFPYPRHIRGMAAGIATLGISTLCLDAFVYYNLGYHINVQSLPEIISLLWNTLTSSPAITTVFAGSLIIIILGLELVASNHAWRHLERLKNLKFARYATSILVGCFALSHSIHIWADANNYFDITKQDNVLPLSYPTTAKTLLARHDLLDIEKYQQARNLQIEGSKGLFELKGTVPVCTATEPSVQVLVFKNNELLNEYLESNQDLKTLEHLIQPSDQQDAIFNLIYGLPAYYNSEKLRAFLPAWSQKNALVSVSGFESFGFKNIKGEHPINITYVDKIAELPKENVIALALAPNNSKELIVTSKAFVSESIKIDNSDGFKQLNDITYSLISEQLNCPTLASATMLGRNLSSTHRQEGVNYSKGVLVTFKKDRITLVNPDGSYKQMSGAEGFILEQSLDIPFLIHSIKELQKFTKSSND
jgi:hypothetical protein